MRDKVCYLLRINGDCASFHCSFLVVTESIAKPFEKIHGMVGVGMGHTVCVFIEL